jgi:hypothetical protein
MKTGLVINGSDVCANETFYLCNINPNVFDYGKFRDLLESMTINSVYIKFVKYHKLNMFTMIVMASMNGEFLTRKELYSDEFESDELHCDIFDSLPIRFLDSLLRSTNDIVKVHDKIILSSRKQSRLDEILSLC